MIPELYTLVIYPKLIKTIRHSLKANGFNSRLGHFFILSQVMYMLTFDAYCGRVLHLDEGKGSWIISVTIICRYTPRIAPLNVGN